MNEVQRQLLDLVCEMDGICREHSIDYVLCGGNALGLERNRGFLPWDDDIDLFITRENYNKLDKVLSSVETSGREWVTEKRFPGYCNPLPRYVDTSSTLISRSRLNDGTPLGQMVEFFVLDPYPSDPKEQLEYQKYLWLYCELQAPRFVVGRLSMPAGVVDEELYRKYEARMALEGKDAVLGEIEEKHLSFPADGCEFLCARWGVKASVVKRSWMENIVYRDFEGVSLPFFADNIDYLYQTEYGFDWTVVPRRNKTQTHDVIANMEVSYQDNIDEVRVMSDGMGFQKALEENKKDNLEILFRRNDYQRESARQMQPYLQLLADGYGKRAWAFDEQYADLLYREFAPFFDQALLFRYSRWGMRVALHDDLAETMCRTLLWRNSMDRIQRFFQVVEPWEGSDRCRSIAHMLIDLKNARAGRDRAKCVALFDQVTADPFIQRQLEVERTRVWLAAQGDEVLDALGIQELVDDICHVNDNEIRKYVGDLYRRAGNRASAANWYDKARGTRNGIVLLELNELGFYA